MGLYDKEIGRLMTYLHSMNPIRLAQKEAWHMTDQETLVLRSDMAYELGGGSHFAVSGLGVTEDTSLVSESGVFLIGSDLPDIKEDVSYARLTFLRLDHCMTEDEGGKKECGIPENESNVPNGSVESYSLLRKLDYTRYHVYPEGYMMRISAVHEREPVRIAREAMEKGMDFASVGQSFIESYSKNPHVKAVQVFFVTDQTCDFARLRDFAGKCELITESLNQVFRGLNMDCSTCGQRALCEEIDGLKELHQHLQK